MNTPEPAPTPAKGHPAAIVLAAGKGLRAAQGMPKQFALWRGQPVLRLAVLRLRAAGAGLIAVAIPEGGQALAQEILGPIEDLIVLTGGPSRQESVARALEALAADPRASAIGAVLIHDAARPDCPPEVVVRLLRALEGQPGAIPVLPVVDSLVRSSPDADADAGAIMAGAARREELWRVQTPQAFRFGAILAAHRAWAGPPTAGDDAQVLHAAGGAVALVAGDERLHKLTFAQDFRQGPDVIGQPSPDAVLPSPAPAPALPIRVGTGFDVHRLGDGEQLWLCGIRIPHARGLIGHSDADVALHALVDAILGALGAGDIGQHFPPSEARWRGAPSALFVEHAVGLAAAAGYAIGNVSLTIVCEAPRIAPHREAMRARLAQLLLVEPAAINIAGTTTERLGFAGRGEGIAAQAVATLIVRGAALREMRAKA